MIGSFRGLAITLLVLAALVVAAFVVLQNLGLLGGSPKFPDCADLSQGVDGAEQSSRLVDFVERFPTHFVGSVCSDGYGGFFQEALDRVATGCANVIP